MPARSPSGPELWFLDEPFSALDPLIRRQMQDEFLRLQRMLNKTIVFITHDIVEAFRLADRIAIMREGEVIQIGRPADIVLNPADDYVARVHRGRAAAARHDGRRSDGGGGRHRWRPAARRSPPTTTLEDLVPRLAAGVPAFAVMDDDGRQLGTLEGGRRARGPGPRRRTPRERARPP